VHAVVRDRALLLVVALVLALELGRGGDGLGATGLCGGGQGEALVSAFQPETGSSIWWT